MERAQWRPAAALATVVVALHVIGFAMLAAGAVGIGLGLTAYTLGLRHAFDADHIAAIDGTTRKLMGEGQRPLSVGFFFSLGHSTVVFALALLFAAGIRAFADDGSTLHAVGGVVGPSVSGGFLLVIGALNLGVLASIVRAVRDGEEAPAPRGVLARVYGRATRGGLGGGGGCGAQAVAHVPPRHPVRSRLRHGERGGVAVPRRGGGLE